MATKFYLIKADEYNRLSHFQAPASQEDIVINTDLKEEIVNGKNPNLPSKIWHLTVKSVPKRAERSCEGILLFLAANDRFKVNSTQEVSIDGELLKGSSLIELIDVLLRIQASNLDPYHWGEWKEFLREIHLPRNLIKNKFRAEEIYSEKKKPEEKRKVEEEADGFVVPAKKTKPELISI